MSQVYPALTQHEPHFYIPSVEVVRTEERRVGDGKDRCKPGKEEKGGRRVGSLGVSEIGHAAGLV